MIRQITTVFTGTLVSRLLGFVRDALIAALLGAGVVADAFLFAFQAVNVARRMLSEGALNAALVPAYLRIGRDNGPAAASAFAGRAFGTIGLGLFVATVLLAMAMPYVLAALAPGFTEGVAADLAVETARLMLPYLAFAGPTAVIAAVLNARNRVALTSFAPILFNLLLIAAIAALLLAKGVTVSQAAFALAATVGIAGCLQVAFLAFAGLQSVRPVRVAFDAEIFRMLRRAVPSMIAQSAPQLLLLAGAIVASASPAAISWLYFASRLVELPLGIVGAATGAVLVPRLSDSQRDNTTEAAAMPSQALQLSLGLTLPAAAGLAVLANPIVAVLFEHGAFTARDTEATAAALTLLATALPAHALIKTFQAMFFAREKTTAPLLTTLAGLAATLLIARLTFSDHGHAGIAAAIAAGAWLIAIFLGVALARTNWLTLGRQDWRNLAAIVLASAAMMAALIAVQRLLPATDAGSLWARIASLGALIAFGALVYIAALRLFGVVTFRIVRKAFGSAE